MSTDTPNTDLLLNNSYLPSWNERAAWMRMDSAAMLKRFFFCTRSLIISQAAWLASIGDFDAKTTLPRFIWQDAVTANSLRERVLELRYPSRMLQVGDDKQIVAMFDAGRNAPNAAAFLLALVHVYKPALLQAYRLFIAISDELADGPSRYLLTNAIRDVSEQIPALLKLAEEALIAEPSHRASAEAWAGNLQSALDALGGVSVVGPPASAEILPVAGECPFRFAEIAARDPRFRLGRFYWPDMIDPSFPYGQGIALQLRSAQSHLNEIWAVETGGAILFFFAEDLGWEFIYDAARWTYDESRHARMGYERLRQWGYELHELPLGSYITDSLIGAQPIYRLGMLSYFETKNIGKKNERARVFAEYHDRVSQRDMEFDWADETIHAHYGAHWLGVLADKAPETNPPAEIVRAHCGALIRATIQSATDVERAELRAVANAMLARAKRISRPLTD